MTKLYSVTIPIAGHAIIEVEADTEEEAKTIALDTVGPEHLESWEALTRFAEGNILRCPTPHRLEIQLLEDDAA